jgi:WhiB family redox-sensing transcriptional regulator
MNNTRRATDLYRELTDSIVEIGGVPCENAPDMFFIDHSDKLIREKIRTTRTLCGGCPLKNLCLEYALEANEQDGIWGGLTRPERNSLQRSRVIRERVY